MIHFKYILILVLICSSTLLLAQEVKSEKSSFRLNNLPVKEAEVAEVVEEKVEIRDLTPPVIRIVTPEIKEEGIFKTEIAEIDLIGKVADENGISFLSVDSKMKEISESGIFTSKLQLHPGENRIRMVAMDKMDNLVERYLVISYIPPVVTLADRISDNATYYG